MPDEKGEDHEEANITIGTGGSDEFIGSNGSVLPIATTRAEVSFEG